MHRFVHFAAFMQDFSIFMHFETVLRYNPVNKGQSPHLENNALRAERNAALKKFAADSGASTDSRFSLIYA